MYKHDKNWLFSLCFLANNINLVHSVYLYKSSRTFVKLQAGLSQDQFPHIWGRILDKAILPPALPVYFFLRKYYQTLTFFKLMQTLNFFKEAILYPSMQWL